MKMIDGALKLGGGHPRRAAIALVAAGVVTAGSMAVTAGAVNGYAVTAAPDLLVRSGPGTGYPVVGQVGHGQALDISCQTRSGSFVHGSDVWDRIGAGYVADYWVSTPVFAAFSPGIPRCGEVTPPASSASAPGGNDYPWAGMVNTGGQDSHGYPYGECTSFAAWRITHTLGASIPAGFHDASSWSGAARAAGLTVSPDPTPGSIAVFQPGVDGAFGFGHVAYVLSATSSSVTVEDYNWVGPHRYGTHTVARTAGLDFIHFGAPQASAPVSTPAPPSTPASSSHRFAVYGTCPAGGCVLLTRAGPTSSGAGVTGQLHEHDAVDIACQTRGETVAQSGWGTSSVWDQLANGSWVSDLYVNTPNVNAFSPPIPQCSAK